MVEASFITSEFEATRRKTIDSLVEAQPGSEDVGYSPIGVIISRAINEINGLDAKEVIGIKE